jgi:GDP-mannose 6-dehydrogenase
VRVSVFGLGYVGTVAAACLADMGHTVLGIDVDSAKVDFVNAGRSPVTETGIDALVAEQVRRGRLAALTDMEEAVHSTDVSFVCVGTPSTEAGHLDLAHVERVCGQIGTALRTKRGHHVIALRSTVLPGTNEQMTEIIEMQSGRARDRDFALVSNPEFLREGSAIRDFRNPPFTLVGASDPNAMTVMREVYHKIEAPFLEVDIRVAEIIKYVNNSFHALKVTFANEIGRICAHLGIDAREVMRIFALDTKLNISPYYLRPGFAYGGSCLPKDLKALVTIAHDAYVACPVVESIHASNEIQKELVLNRILASGRREIGFFGLSFKAGSDDLRNSPIIDVIEKLIGKGFDVLIYDRNVHLATLTGANREYILSRIPLISEYVTDDPDAVVSSSKYLVIVNDEPAVHQALSAIPHDKHVLDLVGIGENLEARPALYEGLSW